MESLDDVKRALRKLQTWRGSYKKSRYQVNEIFD